MCVGSKVLAESTLQLKCGGGFLHCWPKDIGIFIGRVFREGEFRFLASHYYGFVNMMPLLLNSVYHIIIIVLC